MPEDLYEKVKRIFVAKKVPDLNSFPQLSDEVAQALIEELKASEDFRLRSRANGGYRVFPY